MSEQPSTPDLRLPASVGVRGHEDQREHMVDDAPRAIYEAVLAAMPFADAIVREIADAVEHAMPSKEAILDAIYLATRDAIEGARTGDS
jgi:hypothetical protein